MTQHLSGTRGVLVHQNHHVPTKAPLAETLGDKCDGPLSGKLERQRQKLKFEPGNVPEPGQILLVIAMVGRGTIERRS